jgi:hypothetical protein
MRSCLDDLGAWLQEPRWRWRMGFAKAFLGPRSSQQGLVNDFVGSCPGQRDFLVCFVGPSSGQPGCFLEASRLEKEEIPATSCYSYG